MMDVKAFQAEVGAWSRRNFGGNDVNPPHRSLLGIVEELGELTWAVENDTAFEDMADAMGDAMVYAADYCDRNGLDLQRIVGSFAALKEFGLASEVVSCAGSLDGCFRSLLVHVGELSHAHLKQEQGIRTNENHAARSKAALRRIVELIATVAVLKGIDFEEAVASTWERVSKRDWKANPVSGG